MSSAEIGFVAQETEVSSKPRRRRFTDENKRKILKDAAACTKPGEIGALLRREGLYSSNLVEWRRAQERSVGSIGDSYDNPLAETDIGRSSACSSPRHPKTRAMAQHR